MSKKRKQGQKDALLSNGYPRLGNNQLVKLFSDLTLINPSFVMLAFYVPDKTITRSGIHIPDGAVLQDTDSMLHMREIPSLFTVVNASDHEDHHLIGKSVLTAELNHLFNASMRRIARCGHQAIVVPKQLIVAEVNEEKWEENWTDPNATPPPKPKNIIVGEA